MRGRRLVVTLDAMRCRALALTVLAFGTTLSSVVVASPTAASPADP